MRSRASKELLAPIEDVWRFIAEPHHLADWWPGVGGVFPDRRGMASGARWKLTQGTEPGLFRKPSAEWTLVVSSVEPYRKFAFHMTGERLDVELVVEPHGHKHTMALLTVAGPFFLGPRRSLARHALNRLYDLIQTAAPPPN